jgi:hypothetical protein
MRMQSEGSSGRCEWMAKESLLQRKKRNKNTFLSNKVCYRLSIVDKTSRISFVFTLLDSSSSIPAPLDTHVA